MQHLNKKLLLLLFVLINTSLFAQTREKFILANYSLGYSFINTQTTYQYSYFDDLVIENLSSNNYKDNSISFFPSLSFGLETKKQNLLEFELNHFSIKNQSITNPLTQNTEKHKDFKAGIRSSFCMNLNPIKQNNLLYLGPEIYINKGKSNLNRNGISPNNIYVANLGLALKHRIYSKKNIFIQSSLNVEPLRFSFEDTKFSTINIFKKELGNKEFTMVNDTYESCKNCDFLQFKFSIGANI